MPIQFIVTDAGRAALVNAQHSGTNPVTIAQVGVSGTPIVASAATANLPGEVKRIATISGGAVAADTMHVIVRDESADVFTVRSIALYLSDGTLFGAYGQAGVIAEKSAQAMLLLAVDVIFADVNAAMLVFGDANFLNPPATTETAGVVKLAADAEAVAMANALKALTPRGMALAFTAANVLARLLTVDGAGSGLDADLLDGQEGSFYTNITARLGYTPLNAVNYNAGDILGKIVTVDGAGSGLDADLLDGRQATEFALLSGATFTGPIAISAGNIGLANTYFLRAKNTAGVDKPLFGAWSDNRTKILSAGAGIDFQDSIGVTQVTISETGNIARGGNTVWDAANDGAGSGLDADLLDGRHASDFALLLGPTFSNSVTISAAAPVLALQPSGYAGQYGTSLMAAATAEGFLQLGNNGVNTILAGNSGTGGTLRIVVNQSVNAPVVNGVTAMSFAQTGAVSIPISLTVAGNTSWHAGNDGAGSGLDADLLDGRQATEFALLNGSTVFTGAVVSQSNEAFRAAGVSPYYSFTNAAASTRWGYIQHTGAGGALTIANEQAGQTQFQVGGSQPLTLNIGGASIAGTLTVSTAITRAGNTVWDAANDGSGSGLDADLLDGRQATEFALLTGSAFTGDVSTTGTLLLDGSFYLARQGGNPIICFDANDYLQYTRATNSLQIYISGTPVMGMVAGQVSVTGAFSSGGAITRAGSTVWDAANDGSGSGLDADLLDGRHASDFALLTDATRAGSNGNGYWEKRPNGMIEQWGQIAGPFIEQQLIVTFPIAFTDAASVHIVAMGHNYAASDKKDMFIQLVSLSVNGCTLFAQWSAAASSLAQLDGVTWRAIGK